MRLNHTTGARGAAKYRRARAVVDARKREQAVEVVKIKNGLLREYGAAIGGHRDVLQSAINEAEAIAWQTPFPHLLFPVLAQEKAAAINRWAARQRHIRRASREMALAE